MADVERCCCLDHSKGVCPAQAAQHGLQAHWPGSRQAGASRGKVKRREAARVHQLGDVRRPHLESCWCQQATNPFPYPPMSSKRVETNLQDLTTRSEKKKMEVRGGELPSREAHSLADTRNRPSDRGSTRRGAEGRPATELGGEKGNKAIL